MAALRSPIRSRLWRGVLWVLGGLVALVVLAMALLVAVVDQPRVQSVLQRRLSGLANGQIAWDDLQVRLLPVPRARLVGARADFPGTASVRVAETELALRGWALLAGRVEVTAFRARQPSVRLELGAPRAEAPPAAKAAPVDPAAVYREVLDALHRHAPEAVIEIDGGALEVARPDRPPTRLSAISLRLEDDADGATLAASADSDLWQRLNVRARARYADAGTQARLELEGLKPQAILDEVLGGSPVRLELPMAGLRARASSDGHALVECEFEAQAPALALARGERRLALTAAGLSGKVRMGSDGLALRLDDIRLDPVVRAAKAELELRGDGANPRLSAEIPRVDLATLRDAVLALYGDQPAIRDYLPRLRSGEVSGAHWRAEGETWSDLGAAQRMTAGLELSGGEFVPPGLEHPVSGIAGRAELSRGELRVSGLQARVDGSRVNEGQLRYSLKAGSGAGGAAFDIDMAQALALARQALPPSRREALASIEAASGHLRGTASGEIAKGGWRAEARIAHTDAGVRLERLAVPVTVSRAVLRANPKAASVEGADATIGRSRVAVERVQVSLKDGAADGKLAFDVDVAEALEVARQALPPERRSALAPIESAAGHLRGQASGGLAKGRWQAAADIGPSDASVRLAGLPGPVTLSRAVLRANPDALDAAGVDVAFLDSRVVASATVAGYRAESPALGASVSEGVLGEKTAAYLLRRTGTPARLEPATPLRFTAQRVRWQGGALEAAARLQFPAGQRVELELGWKPEALDVPRLRIVDDRSDATVSLQVKRQNLITASFRGRLRGATLEAMTKARDLPTGQLSGDLRVTVDRNHPEQTEAEGRLEASDLDLSGVLGRPVRIDQLAFASDPASARLENAVLDLDGQKVSIHGDVKRGAGGPVVDAEIESDGLVLDRLLPPPSPAAGQDDAAAPKAALTPSAIWPLPVTGRVFVRMDYLEYRGRRVAPVLVSLELEREQASLDVAEAQVCGLEVPLQVKAAPGGYDAAVRIHAAKEDLERIARCLSGSGVLITGALDLDANLRTHGAPDALVKNLQGTVTVRAEKGRVHKFGLLANLLAYVKGAGLLEKDAPGLDREGFPYRELTVDAHVGEGKVQVEQATFLSDALGLVATGAVGIPDLKASLTVLVAPFGQVDKLLGKIPIVGYLTGGSLISLPVQVSGDIRDPLVVPLDPRAIASRVLGIFERTFKLPQHLLAPAEGGGSPPTAR